jgi:2-dehydro-3-deoxyphosphogluconate aldolase/(4S)-4-hydroxy-2-oxoglutarate aldolase
MHAMEYGLRFLKFFPAELAGGVNMLKNFAALFGDVKFCPTGGIGKDTAKNYLALPNVLCIGGSWIVPTQAVKDGNWKEITRLCREAMEAVGTAKAA